FSRRPNQLSMPGAEPCSLRFWPTRRLRTSCRLKRSRGVPYLKGTTSSAINGTRDGWYLPVIPSLSCRCGVMTRG
ncbi:uncharacterized protein METZ01_LOCUS324835, partial [marine metagenome]